ncbi:MAG TPA: winged helix DNA-binding domain-containing protein [Blastocatellia bacterium]|nr:winged helix DNA-binding domain-containing protein [Blastocatellia bacterium]HMY72583.1 winged helix DNA-binding domain-containing protein [Blastocatellia bacterium]HMZ19213.1 winged helix DNA-binding domain-containing protein [Blastocatellia bacterium]HNG33627.1 winged helix DNA-binding domain-containing protein [Blastocatellia bacterium]
MTNRILKLRELNRATLSRQMLLQRESLPVAAAIERLTGLQAQLASAPYVGLWTRLSDFKREDLAREIENRRIVKATLMRGTLHLFTTDDYVRFRTTMQPLLEAGANSIAKNFGAEFDLDKLLAAARKFIAEKPRTFAEISDWAAELFPGVEVGPLRYSVRTHIPLVQVPISGGWGYSSKPEFTLAEDWIGHKTSPKDLLPELVKRYLAAFGPASVTDAQTWLGMKLKNVFEKLRPELQSYRGEGRVELFDLPGIELPAEDKPAPVRFLPEYDNLLLSHSNRTRVVADEYRSRVYLPGLRVAATILVDGFVQGAWKIEKSKTAATLVITPFDKLTKKDHAALSEEGEQLLRFVEAAAKTHKVEFAASA